MNGVDVDEQLRENLLSILLNGDIKRLWSRWGDGSSVSRYITEVNVDELLHLIVLAMRFVMLSWRLLNLSSSIKILKMMKI